MPKITFIGAGSVVFAKNLIGDILQFPELADSTICLMDIDSQRLKVAEVMAKKMVACLNGNARIEATLDQRKAIQGADYVICTIQVGGYKPGTVIDFEIPKKYGVRQTIADTLGVGGVFRALRTIPVINSIARNIADVGNPGCLLLNYTNPMAMNCWAVAREVGIPHVGLCHSVQGTSQQLASFLNLPYKDITYKVAGINHMAFFMEFKYKGQDAYPLLFKLLDNPDFNQEKVRFEMMRRLGYFVTESSEHQSEYSPYFIHHGKKLIERFDIPLDEYIRRCESIIGTWEKAEADLLGGEGKISISPQSHEYGSFIIHSKETNTPRVIYGNVPNTNLITNLPVGSCVEVPCLVDAMGVQPTVFGSLPPQLAAMCQTNINVQSLTVEAALTKKREHIYHAVMLDPHTSSVLTLDKIWEMCDELISAHQKHGLLSSFHPTIKNTGRTVPASGIILASLHSTSAIRQGDTGKKEMLLKVENESSAAFSGTLNFKTQPGVKATESSLNFKVAAGKTFQKKMAFNLIAPLEQESVITITCPNNGVFCRKGFLSPRSVYDFSKQPASFELKLGGIPAVIGEYSILGSSLTFDFSVFDSDITPVKIAPWTGSCVELFFDNKEKSNVIQLFCVPDPKGKMPHVLKRDLSRIESAKIRQSSIAGGYRMQVQLPLSVVSDRKENSILFNSIFNLTALGDAHSGGRVELNVRQGLDENSRHYSELIWKD